MKRFYGMPVTSEWIAQKTDDILEGEYTLSYLLSRIPRLAEFRAFEGVPLEELEKLYLALAAQVFAKVSQPNRMQRLLLTGATYKANRLEAILKEALPRLLGAEGRTWGVAEMMLRSY